MTFVHAESTGQSEHVQTSSEAKKENSQTQLHIFNLVISAEIQTKDVLSNLKHLILIGDLLVSHMGGSWQQVGSVMSEAVWGFLLWKLWWSWELNVERWCVYCRDDEVLMAEASRLSGGDAG